MLTANRLRGTLIATAIALFFAASVTAQPPVERTIGLQQYVRLTLEPLKSDGLTIGQVDSSDHQVVWRLNGVVMGSGMTEVGVVRINHGGETCDVHAGGPDGDGTMTLVLSATGDADMTPGEVRDITWTVTLEITVLPDEAVTGAGRVSAPLNI